MNKQILFKDSKIAYKITGKGPTVVLLHGFLENLSMWEHLESQLNKTNCVICIDLPGFGNSDAISDNHTMDIMAESVYEILKHENISKCTMVGHSMGGYVTLAFADKYENILTGIVLFHSQAFADDDNTKLNRNRTIKIVEENHAHFISSFIPTLFTDENAKKHSDEIKLIVQQSLQTKNAGITAALAGMRDRNDYQNLLSKLKIPVLFIIGKSDTRIPLDKILKQIVLPKISECLILSDVGHMGFIEAKYITNNAVIQFVNRHN